MRNFLLVAMLLAWIVPLGAESAAKENAAPEVRSGQTRQAPPPRGERFRRNNYWMWRAFSQMSDNERKTMTELQRSDPEKFQTEMRKRGEELWLKEQNRRKEIRSLVAQYENADAKCRAEIKKRLTEMEKVEFSRRLKELSRQVEATRERVVRMEEELKKRRLHSEKIIEVRVEEMLKGELFEKERPPRHDAPPPPPPPPPLPAEKSNAMKHNIINIQHIK